jgi:protein kinase A
MIDINGYVKIVDFGCSKLLTISDKTRSMVGTPEYISPEMILCKEYNRSVDIWQLGVLIFELLTRFTPFQHNNLVMIYRNIVESEEVLSCHFSNALVGIEPSPRDMVSQILVYHANMRLGMLHNGLKDLWESPFFDGIDQLLLFVLRLMFSFFCRNNF